MPHFQTGQHSCTIQARHTFVIDEVKTGLRHIYEAIDRTRCDIRENDCMFGRLTVVFTGDWRQVMPVVHHGSRLDTADACVKKSYTYIWKYVHPLEMTENGRARKTG